MADAARDALITGLGAISAAGVSAATHASPSARPTALSAFDGSGMPVKCAFHVGKIPVRSFLVRRKDLKLMSRDARLALTAAGLALESAGVRPMEAESWPVDRDAVGLFMGVGLEPGEVTDLGLSLAHSRRGKSIDLDVLGSEGLDLIPPLSALKTLPNMALAHVAINFGLMGPGESLSPWSTSGVSAMAAAVEAIARGECDVALVGAADSEIDLNGLTNWLRIGLASTASEPDPAEPGLTFGEGGAFVVVESRELAERRGAPRFGRVALARCRRQPAREFGALDTDLLSAMVGAARAAGARRLAGLAGDHGPFREAERRAAASADIAVEYPSDGFGSCGAATSLLGLVSLLARDEADAVGALAWAPSGEQGVVVVDQRDEQ